MKTYFCSAAIVRLPLVCPALRGFGLLLICVVAAVSTQAAVAPYASDSATLHLWHLDEVSVPAVDAAAGGTNLTSLLGGASLGSDSYPGFGTALNTIDGGQSGTSATARNAVLSALVLADGWGDNVSMSFCDPVTGAFTFEAVVRVNFDPAANLSTRGSPMQILSAEADDSDPAPSRLFQWRLNPVGFGGGDTSVPRLEFINLRQGAAIQSVIVPIPTNGPHAIVSNGWFHAAVTFNGAAGQEANLSFFWTALNANNVAANRIGTASLANGLSAGVAPDFCIGNEGRVVGGSTDNFVGLIDEVRISSVARTEHGFFWRDDSDEDGLADSWETNHFGSLLPTAGGDPDSDSYTNLQEFQAGSNPTNSLSTPLDKDADGFPDAWELTHFGTLALGQQDDPDNDQFTNQQEYAAGSQPNNSDSTPNDVDGDKLPDAWEMSNFGSLAQNTSGDPDNDAYTNLQEYQAGTNPASASSVPVNFEPALPSTRYIPVEDGDPGTSEFGYAGSSSINSVAFICSALTTVSNQQFIAYYGRHQTNASYAFNNTIWIGRRTVGSNTWEVFRTTFMANNITDGHDVVCFGIDGDGYMHLSWGMHGDAFHYAKSLGNVVGIAPIDFGPDTTMTGAEFAATYPQFLTVPGGDLLYIYRKGSSGAGDTYINRYVLSTGTWTNIHKSGSTVLPFIKGTGWPLDYNAYGQMPCIDDAGRVFLVWTWRYTPAFQSNHDFAFAMSPDSGLTWRRYNGSSYALPISESVTNGSADPNTVAERILQIPQNYTLINQAGMCLDADGKPVIATWWAPGSGTNNFRRQYMVSFPDDYGVWQVRQISNRTNDPVGTITQDAAVRDLGRPVVVCDRDNRIIVAYRDNFGSNGLTVAHTLPKAVDPGRTLWTTVDLTTDNLGNYEPVIDLARWQRDGLLSFLYQPSSGRGYSPPANTAAEMAVLEWDAAAYFNHRPAVSLRLIHAGVNASLVFRSQLGWGYRVQSSSDLAAWTNLATLSGTGGYLQYIRTNSIASRQFFRIETREGGFSL